MNQQFPFSLFGCNLQQILTTIAIGLLILSRVAFCADVKIPEIQAAAEKGQVSKEMLFTALKRKCGFNCMRRAESLALASCTSSCTAMLSLSRDLW